MGFSKDFLSFSSFIYSCKLLWINKYFLLYGKKIFFKNNINQKWRVKTHSSCNLSKIVYIKGLGNIGSRSRHKHETLCIRIWYNNVSLLFICRSISHSFHCSALFALYIIFEKIIWGKLLKHTATTLWWW